MWDTLILLLTRFSKYAIPDPIPESRLVPRSGDDSSSSEEDEFNFEIGGGTLK
jgi:hypothetical protein